MANYCPHCGAQLPRPGATFCVTCGRSLQARPTTSSTSAAPQLRIQLPGHPEETFVIARPRVTIGRDPTNDLVLDSPIVSRRHAELEVRADGVWLRDIQSANGTAVNGRPSTEQALRDGDAAALVQLAVEGAALGCQGVDLLLESFAAIVDQAGEAELVLVAMGFVHVTHAGLVEDLGLQLDERGNVVVDNHQTSEPWVFAAGDTVRGASLVVHAIRSGQDAAAATDRWLRQECRGQ